MHLPLDYPSLRVIWWLLLGVLLAGFAIMDGFDLGVAMLLPYTTRNNIERRIAINTVGPVWEGNQVWLILGAGAIFAAWPDVYAVTFSGFYFAMLMVLFALIIRPVGFKYRSKIDNTGWRALWDTCLFINGVVPALIFGVAIGNALQGVPFYFDSDLLSFYTGNLWGLLNPFALLCGLTSVAMLAMHGAIYQAGKTEGEVRARSRRAAQVAALFTILLFAIGGIWLANFLRGYAIVNGDSPYGVSNPFHKQVILQTGAWLANYRHYPLTLAAPIAGLAGALLAFIFTRMNAMRLAWLASATSIAGIIATVGVSLFPFILPSSTNPSMSLTVWDASSSQLTLFIMLIAAIIFVPIVLTYTAWVYRVMRGTVTAKDIDGNAY